VVAGLAFAAALAVATFVPVLQAGDTVPALPLVDQTGAAFSFDTVRGDAVVLGFIYTRCADPRMCPLTSSKFARLQSMLGSTRVRLVEITLDPAYDTPAVMRAYGAAFGADARRWTLATGAPASIDALAARLGVATQWTTPGTLVHTESVIVLDRAGRVADVIDGNDWTPGDVFATAVAVADDAPSLGARVRLWFASAVERCGGGTAGVSTLAVLALLCVSIGGAGTALLRSIR
jgi:cytochrome oxidase Cu insertion factor (SCO1/SenC/PrrC family)